MSETNPPYNDPSQDAAAPNQQTGQAPQAPGTAPQPGIDTQTGQHGHPADILPGLESQLRDLELKAQEHHDAWLRAKAETENVRRRAQADVDAARKFAVEKFAQELLPVKDSLELALADQSSDPATLRAGVELTLKQLLSAFEKSRLTEVNPVGQRFDPNQHQAISMLESDQEANTVVTVLQKGYLLADRVLRPAMVTVAKARSPANPT